MKNIIFDERRDIEQIMSSGRVTLEMVDRVIMSMAKYNLWVNEMDDEENKSNICQWLEKHYSAYVETEYDPIINNKIKLAHQYNLIVCDDLLIYQSELDIISQLNNVRMEKVLFALLCVAKLQRNMFGYRNGKYQLSLTNIFKLARVHIQSTKRDLFMHELLKQGFISAPYTVDGEERWIHYICEDGEPVLKINEADFEELAYVYLNWKNKSGYTRCQQCNRFIKQSKTKPKKYCEECAKTVVTEQKRLWAEKSRKNLTQQND